MRSAIVIIACLALGGCKMLDADNAMVQEGRARSEMKRAEYEARRDSIRAASARAARTAVFDTALAGSSYQDAKVAAVMRENNIDLPMVAAYLYARGFTVHPTSLPRWHWTPPTTGAPVSYYTFRLVGAVGDTTLTHYLPQVAGTYRLEVRGVSGAGAVGPWSVVGWSDSRGAGGALPGVVHGVAP